jgi:pilus assembly protein Flp/PilA
MFKKFTAGVRKAAINESGATAIEYGLIAAGIAVVIIFSVNQLGLKLDETFKRVVAALSGGG